MKTCRIFLVDDHVLVRAGIRALLELLPGVEIVGEAADGREAMAALVAARADVVLTDVAMAGQGGLALAARLALEQPQTKVLMLSMHANEEYVMQALKAGAAGYLLKDAAAAELKLALAAIARGETYLSPAISRRVIDAYLSRTKGVAHPADPLTSRQRETLRLIAEGKSTKEIAHEMWVSVKTIETHRTDLMNRLAIHDVAGLVKYALRTGVVE